MGANRCALAPARADSRGRLVLALAGMGVACGGAVSPMADAGTADGTTRGDTSSSGPSDPSASTSGTTVASTGADGSESGTDTGATMGYPEPGDHPPNTGPGGPAVPFDAAALYIGCAFLDGGATDADHHNEVVMFDGYLMMPWSPEFGGGGLSFYDISDPCAPQPLSHTAAANMRETHATGILQLDDRYYAVTAAKDPSLLDFDGGILVWDVTNVAAPEVVAQVNVDGHFYPDAYARVVLSAAWHGTTIYVGGADNGIYIVDASEPTAPTVIGQYALEPTLRVGQVNAIGTMLVATAAEGPRTVLLDISVPDFPQPIAGGDFEIVDASGMIRESYFSNVGGGYVYYAIKNGAGGLLVYDIRDPSAPVLAGGYDSGGNGGYVFAKDTLAFVGESSFAGIYDLEDMSAITQVAQLQLVGDLDTATPIGNVVVLSVDDEAIPDQASSIVPYATEVDATPPHVTWAMPADGTTDLPVSTVLGVTFSEMVDVKSAWFGSVRLYRLPQAGEDEVPVEGIISVQENVVNFAPRGPLDPGTTYVFEIPAGGVADYNGNAVEEPFSMTFTTVGG